MNNPLNTGIWERLIAPAETDPVKAMRERLAKAVLLVTFVISAFATVLCFAGWIMNAIPLDTVVGFVFIILFLGIGFLFSHRGLWRIGGILPVVVFYLAAVIGNYIGGISVPAILLYVISIILVGMIYGGLYQWLGLIICILSYLGIAYAHFTGYIQRIRSDDTAFYNRVTITVTAILCIFLLVRFIVKQYQLALVKIHSDRDEMKLLAKNNEMLYRQSQEEIATRRRIEEQIQSKNEDLTAVNEELTAALEELETTNEEMRKTNEDLINLSNELQYSEERFRVSAMTTGEIIYDYDVGTGKIIWAGAIEMVTGYTAAEFERIDIGEWERMIHPDNRVEALEKLNRAMEELGEYNVKYRFLHKNGSYIYIEDNGVFLADDRGGAYRMLGSMIDITERHLADERIKNSLNEKEVLLKEIHHRVKNNFQIIVSLLGLQLGKSINTETISNLKDAQNRIRAMSLIHEKLYQSKNLSMIDFGEYMKTMAMELYRGLCEDNTRIMMEVQAERVELSIERAIPFGLAASELITNAIKYAFPGNRQGMVKVLIEKGEEDGISVTISDNGAGLPDLFDPEKTESLGFRLVYLLIRDQMQGEIFIGRDRGTSVTMKYRKQPQLLQE